MGMFDTVLVPCPECGHKEEFQTKGGICGLYVYELEDCPHDALSDINRHSPCKCENCGTYFEVKYKIQYIINAKSIKSK